jgi:hypothetical protein
MMLPHLTNALEILFPNLDHGDVRRDLSFRRVVLALALKIVYRSIKLEIVDVRKLVFFEFPSVKEDASHREPYI